MIYFMYVVCGLIIGLSLYYLYLVVKNKKVNMVTPVLDAEGSVVKVGHVAPTVETPNSFVPSPPRPTSVNRNTPTKSYSTPNNSTNKPPRYVDPLRTVSDGDNYCKYESSSCSSTDSGSSSSSSDGCSESSSSYSSSSSCD